jgi:hypothetical protein
VFSKSSGADMVVLIDQVTIDYLDEEGTVNFPTPVYINDGTPFDDSYTTLASVPITTSGKIVEIDASGDYIHDGGTDFAGRLVVYRVSSAGSETFIANSGVKFVTAASPCVHDGVHITDTPAAGVWTYRLKAWRYSGNNALIERISLIVKETR